MTATGFVVLWCRVVPRPGQMGNFGRSDGGPLFVKISVQSALVGITTLPHVAAWHWLQIHCDTHVEIGNKLLMRLL